ncbi:MAG: transglycosylase SLT domain-containing protein, partial [Anaerolineales bacterium]
FIWKTVVKPVIRWVTEAIRTLRTWVENVVRWVVERIQDGWNYITRQIAETIREWVEKVKWVRKWVTKEIIVPQVVWETRVIPLPVWNDPANIYRLLQLGATVGLGTISLSMCATAASTPPAPTPDISATHSACATQTVAAWTQTALAITPTSTPTATSMPCYLAAVHNKDQLNTNWGFGVDENLYNQEILNASTSSGVPAWVLKGLIAAESGFDPTAVSPSAAYGLMQITGNGMSALFEKN